MAKKDKDKKTVGVRDLEGGRFAATLSDGTEHTFAERAKAETLLFAYEVASSPDPSTEAVERALEMWVANSFSTKYLLYRKLLDKQVKATAGAA